MNKMPGNGKFVSLTMMNQDCEFGANDNLAWEDISQCRFRAENCRQIFRRNSRTPSSMCSSSYAETSCNNNNGHSSSSASSVSEFCDQSGGQQQRGDFPSLSVLSENLPQVGAISHHKTNDDKLIELMKKTGYEMVQRNGQRIYGGPPPNWKGPPPPKGSEVFVGKVPRDCFEWELVPIFETVGPIYELRLMMDFSGSNRGYMFVRYTCREDAKRSVRELNNYEIRPNKFLGVINSVDNRKLWMSGIPKNRTAGEIKAEMEKMTDGVRDVILYPCQSDKSKTRGYAFVEYENHRAAALARRKLVPGRIVLFDQEVEKVDWAEPENEVDEEIMATVKVLFVRNLMISTTEDKIRNVFEQLADGEVERVRKNKDYAFVHLASRSSAEMAYNACKKGLVIDGSSVEVTWSKPIDRQMHNQRKQLTKALTSPNSMLSMSEMSPAIPTPLHPAVHQALVVQNNYGRGGAPGTAPPKSLVKKLTTSGVPFGAGQPSGDFYAKKPPYYMLDPYLCIPPAGPPTSPLPLGFYAAAAGQPDISGNFNPGNSRIFPAAAVNFPSQMFFAAMQ